MARYTKQDAFTVPQINNELEKIEQAIQDTLSRKGDAPNTMTAPLDMNGERVLNLPEPVADTEPLRRVDATQYVTAAASSAAAALASEQAAAASAEEAGISESLANTAVEISEDLFDELNTLYLGSFTTGPATDNQGDPLVQGVLYYNTVQRVLFVFNGSIWVEAASQEAANSAAISADEAEDSADAALASQQAAATSATSAASSASSATTSALSASSSAQAANSSAQAASASETNAGLSAASANASANTAQSAATSATNSATAATTSETNAASSAAAAASSATNASSSATAAAGSASSAAASETAAAGSATSAASSASAASDSADAALASEQAADSAASAAEDARDEAVAYASAFSKGLIFIGVYDASVGSFPTLPDPLIGNPFWIINVAGTISGTSYDGGDTLIYDSTAEDWIKLDTTDRVVSVAGKVGAVTLVKADVGLSNVDNTSDLNKPISTATQTALDSKVNQSDQEIIKLKSEQSKDNASLVLDFAKNDLRVYEQFAGLTPKQFTDLISFTRATNETGFTPSKLATAASGTAVQNAYDPSTGEPLGLQVFEQKTNISRYSEDFGNAVWAPLNASVDVDVTKAPDGSTLADRLVGGAIGVQCRVTQSGMSVTSGLQYTYSVHVKKDTERYAFIVFTTSGSAFPTTTCIFDFDTETVTNTFGVVNSGFQKLANGYYRIFATATATATANANVGHGLTNSPSLVGGGSTLAMYHWGTQFEQGSFPTPYIKTEATTATRNASVAVINDIDESEWWNPSEGTFVVEWNVNGGDFSNVRIVGGFSQPAAPTDNRLHIFYLNGELLMRNGRSSPEVVVSASPSFGRNKLAFCYDELNELVRVSLNGVDTLTMGYTNYISEGWAVDVGSRPTGAFLNGHIANILYYPTAVSDAKLQELSTL